MRVSDGDPFACPDKLPKEYARDPLLELAYRQGWEAANNFGSKGSNRLWRAYDRARGIEAREAARQRAEAWDAGHDDWHANFQRIRRRTFLASCTTTNSTTNNNRRN